MKNVSLSKVPNWDANFVEVKGIKRGIIWPVDGQWAASRMGGYRSQNPRYMHGAFATKQAAIQAIVIASRHEPPHIVFPAPDPAVRDNWSALGVSH
jgi:hypothetical protein